MYNAKFEKELTKQKEVVQIICIMDGSGSMDSIMDECVGAFNNFIEEQKVVEGDAELTLIAFDESMDVIYDKVNIQEVKKLTRHDVFLGGMTALNDAIGLALKNADENKKTICLIQTDGYENASQEYKKSFDIKNLIKQKQNLGWEFLFIGAGIDAFSESERLGLSVNNARSVDASEKGMEYYGKIITAHTTNFRTK